MQQGKQKAFFRFHPTSSCSWFPLFGGYSPLTNNPHSVFEFFLLASIIHLFLKVVGLKSHVSLSFFFFSFLSKD
jgi:hypothetical protein